MATPGLAAIPGFSKFWWASSVSEFGTYLTSVAMAVLIKYNLHGSTTDLGWVDSARWLPYALFGLLVGVIIDRARRRPIQIAADLVRSVLLIVVAVLAMTNRLPILVLVVFMAVFGLSALVGDAASQAFLPRIVPAPMLTRAHARIDQSSAVAQTAGPGIAGVVIAVIGAPWAFVADAVSYLFSGLMLIRIRVREPAPDGSRRRAVRVEVSEGLRWVYRHATLGPLAVITHLWFVFAGIAGVVLPFFLLDTVKFSSNALNTLALGAAGSIAGIGALIGSSAAPRLGVRFGTGHVVVGCHAMLPVAYALLAVSPANSIGRVLIGVAEIIIGLSLGASNSNEMGYRQTVTPDHLQGRMNATMRSINRAMLVIAAPVGGVLADAIGYRLTLWIVAAGFAGVAVALGLSAFGSATLKDYSL